MDDGVTTTGEFGNEEHFADIVLSASEGGHNDESNDDPLPTSSEVTGSFALVWRFCTNVEGCTLSCSDSLDYVKKCMLSQAVRLLKKKIQWNLGDTNSAYTNFIVIRTLEIPQPKHIVYNVKKFG